ncbi:MAG: Ig-like domain-containing protein [Clostridia bacterium]|nr:Ig-like domain-containing protein [Clostridia bacterium]
MKIKKSILIFAIIIIAILTMTKSEALTISTTETPTTVTAGQNFQIKMKFDKNLIVANGYIDYDSDLISIEDSSADLAVAGKYTKGTASWIYEKNGDTVGINEIVINATAKNVTKETVAKIVIADTATVQADGTEETLENIPLNITINPSNELKLNKTEVTLTEGESETLTVTGNGTITWKSSNENIVAVDNNGKITAKSAGTATITVTDELGKTAQVKVTVTKKAVTTQNSSSAADKDHAKAGENKFLLIIALAMAIASVIVSLKYKKFNKLFVMLPILITVSVATHASNASTITVNHKIDYANDRIDAGIFDDLIKDKLIIAVSPRSEFYREKDTNRDKLMFNDLEKLFSDNSIEISKINGEDKSDIQLKTGDILKDSNNEEYTIVLFGDVNGNGTICEASDVLRIKQFLLKNEEIETKPLTEEQRLAANIKYQTDDNGNPLLGRDGLPAINAFDIARMKYKVLGLDGRIIDKETGEKAEDYLNGTLIYESIYANQDNFSLSTDEGKTWKNYATLAETVEAAGTNASTIKVRKNAVVEENATIKNNQNITFNLNGKAVALYNSTLTNNGTLTISGTSGTLIGYGANTIENTGKLVKNTNTTISNKSTTDYYVINNSGTFEMSAGTLESSYRGINNDGTGNVTISGGTISTTNYAMRNNSSLNTETTPAIKITGDTTIKTTERGAIINAITSTGLVYIENGDINCQSTESYPTILNVTTEENPGKILITGGTIKNAGKNAVIYNSALEEKDIGTGIIEVRGGTITSSTAKIIYNSDKGIVNVSGGNIEYTGEKIAGESKGSIIDNSQGEGLVNISGGTIVSEKTISIISNGTVNISGGTITTAGEDTKAVRCVTLDFSGGILYAKQESLISADTTTCKEGYKIVYSTETKESITWHCAKLEKE